MSLDHGNARVAAVRGRLLGQAAIARLTGSATAGVFLTALERHEDWSAIVRGVLAMGDDPAAMAEAAIERHRSARLGALPAWYDGPSKCLVEALVLPLDLERVLALVRRRRAGEPADAVVATVVPGALLGARALGRVARVADLAGAIALLVELGVLDRSDPERVPTPTGRPHARGRPPAAAEAELVGAFDRARARRARGRGRDAAQVRALLAREREDRAAVAEALRDQGPGASTLLEGSLTLARLGSVAAAGYRDPLGIGAAMGYVAAVEAQAIRLRAALARVRAGWTADQLAPWLAPTGVVTGATTGIGRWRAWSW